MIKVWERQSDQQTLMVGRVHLIQWRIQKKNLGKSKDPQASKLAQPHHPAGSLRLIRDPRDQC